MIIIKINAKKRRTSMTETLLLPAPAEPAPEIFPEVVEAFQKIAEKAKEIIKAIVEALQPVIEWTVKAIRRIWDAIARGLVPKKWWHLYKHAKKRRIRKKYEKRIRERVLAFLSEAEA